MKYLALFFVLIMFSCTRYVVLLVPDKTEIRTISPSPNYATPLPNFILPYRPATPFEQKLNDSLFRKGVTGAILLPNDSIRVIKDSLVFRTKK